MNTSGHIIDIRYEDSSEKKRIDEEVVEAHLGKILDALGVKDPVEFSVSFVDDEAIHKLNKQYRGIDRPTDILTFVQEDDKSFPGMPAEQARVLGDMVISLGSMQQNAEAFGVSESEELYRLLIHGVLHLLGENHQSNEVEKEPMLQKQEALLVKLGGKKA